MLGRGEMQRRPTPNPPVVVELWEGHLSGRGPPGRGRIPNPMLGSLAQGSFAGKRSPHGIFKRKSMKTVCPSSWGGGRLETHMPSCRNGTVTYSFVGTDLISGGEMAAREVQEHAGKDRVVWLWGRSWRDNSHCYSCVEPDIHVAYRKTPSFPC